MPTGREVCRARNWPRSRVPSDPQGSHGTVDGRQAKLVVPGVGKLQATIVARQHAQLRAAFSGIGTEVDRWLEEVDRTPTFYFDAITQLEMPTWSRGRVTLVGDAGYCPGPAVGGSTSLAVYGAYVLATELTQAGGDHVAAFAAYERTMMPSVLGSRSMARVNAKAIVPEAVGG
jgi:2-polyprenyl-6-methoxyphenol hydroxylase-like FAD-dependent oxidoreductase